MLANQSIFLMGTRIDIQIESKQADQLIQEVIELLHLYNKRFSANDESSELAVVNQNAGVKKVIVHPELFELITIGKKHSLDDPSNLNIAIGPLVQTWRIGFSDAKKPDDQTIQDKLSYCHPENIILNTDKKSVFLSKTGMKIDLGALAKGYIADRIIDFLKANGATSALINLGGNVLVFGPNPKRDNHIWNVGIQNPYKERGNNLAILPILNQSVVTSGVYERQLKTTDGKTYHHIFNTKTGYPIETKMMSLTIVAKLSCDCEIWTSRLFGLDIHLALKTINATPGIEGIIVTQALDIIISDELKQKCYLLPK